MILSNHMVCGKSILKMGSYLVRDFMLMAYNMDSMNHIGWVEGYIIYRKL